MIFKKKNAAQTVGMIELLDPGDEKNPAYIAVSYMAGEQEYTIKETVKMKNKPIKVGKQTVGYKKLPAMSWVEIGAEIPVMYDTNDPAKGWVPKNKGSRKL